MPKVAKGKKKGYRKRQPIDTVTKAAQNDGGGGGGGSGGGGGIGSGRLRGFQADRKTAIQSSFQDAKDRLAKAKAAGDKGAAHQAHADIKAARKQMSGYVTDKKAAKVAQRGSGKKNKKK
jgi:hypothetical protein